MYTWFLECQRVHHHLLLLSFLLILTVVLISVWTRLEIDRAKSISKTQIIGKILSGTWLTWAGANPSPALGPPLPAPHRSFSEEVGFLNKYFKSGEAFILGDPDSPNNYWHVYVAHPGPQNSNENEIRVEMCMTGLDREKASVFFKTPDNDGKMTKMSGISNIIPSHTICDFEFEPCGYSMNGIDNAAYSTIHVTPEEGFSYASYEAMGFDPTTIGFEQMVKRVLECFKPAELSIAITSNGSGDEWWRSEVGEYDCKIGVKQELPGGGCIVYLCFSVDENKWRSSSVKSVSKCRERFAEEIVEATEAGDKLFY